MQVEIDGKIYTTKYFPFFRVKSTGEYTVYGIRYPSGSIEKIIVFDPDNYRQELASYLKFLIKEYMLEDDDVLTPFAQRLKEDIYELFDTERR